MTSEIQHNFDIAKGVLATTVGTAGLVISALEQIEAWLRVGSLVVTILVGLVTIWSILKKKSK